MVRNRRSVTRGSEVSGRLQRNYAKSNQGRLRLLNMPTTFGRSDIFAVKAWFVPAEKNSHVGESKDVGPLFEITVRLTFASLGKDGATQRIFEQADGLRRCEWRDRFVFRFRQAVSVYLAGTSSCFCREMCRDWSNAWRDDQKVGIRFLPRAVPLTTVLCLLPSDLCPLFFDIRLLTTDL